MMKERLIHYFGSALAHPDRGLRPPDDGIHFSRPKQSDFGDWSTNIALQSSGRSDADARQLAQTIVARLPKMPEVEECSLAGPRFISIYLRRRFSHRLSATINRRRNDYGRHPSRGESVLIEYVSANPAGSLHLGRGRVAALGSTLVAIMRAAVGALYRPKKSIEAILAQFDNYPWTIQRAAQRLEPAILVRYPRELASALHINYNDQPYSGCEPAMSRARLLSVASTRRVLSKALQLSGASVPDKM